MVDGERGVCRKGSACWGDSLGTRLLQTGASVLMGFTHAVANARISGGIGKFGRRGLRLKAGYGDMFRQSILSGIRRIKVQVQRFFEEARLYGSIGCPRNRNIKEVNGSGAVREHPGEFSK